MTCSDAFNTLKIGILQNYFGLMHVPKHFPAKNNYYKNNWNVKNTSIIFLAKKIKNIYTEIYKIKNIYTEIF